MMWGLVHHNRVMGQMVLYRVTQLKSIGTMLCRVVENAQNTMSSLRGKQTPKTNNDEGLVHHKMVMGSLHLGFFGYMNGALERVTQFAHGLEKNTPFLTCPKKHEKHATIWRSMHQTIMNSTPTLPFCTCLVFKVFDVGK